MSSDWEEVRGKEERRKDDSRTRYQRDYARLIHSAAFRRLQNKTQILGLGESDFYRTRLTHSLEVMQIGQGIVNYIKHHKKKFLTIQKHLPENELIQSICLAHDIGHPPFGHGGEVALNLCMLNYGGFEGNGQTLRILSNLEKYTENNGINPSRRFLLGVLKYPATFKELFNQNESNKPPKCFLDTELDIVNWILECVSSEDKDRFRTFYTSHTCHSKTKYKALDTSIMELADDISYGVHDLEDGIALGLILDSHLEDWEQKIPCKYASLYKKLRKKLFHSNHCERKHAIGSLVHMFIVNIKIIENGFHNPYLNFNVKLGEDEEAFLKILKKIVVEKLINNTNVQLLEYKGKEVVAKLFNIFKTSPEKFLPDDFKKAHANSDSEEAKMRVICDYIAGMTDPYAAKLYLKLTQPGAGSIFEHL